MHGCKLSLASRLGWGMAAHTQRQPPGPGGNLLLSASVAEPSCPSPRTGGGCSCVAGRLCSALAAAHRYMLPGRYGRCCIPDRLLRASRAAVMLEAGRLSDCNRLSRLITLHSLWCCFPALPIQNSAAGMRGRAARGASPAPPSGLMLWGWLHCQAGC